MLGCNRNIDNKFNQFEKMTVTTPVETTNHETTSDDTTEETTEEIIENVDEMLLLQKVMLNQMKVVSAPINSDEYYLKDDSIEYDSFGIIDLGNDGLYDVILYSKNKHIHISVLYVMNGSVYCSKFGDINECFMDGFLGAESNYVVKRYKYNPRTGEYKNVLSIYYDAQGNITKGENYLQYYEQFSKIPITKYEYTEENVLIYLQSNKLIIPETPST